MSCTSSTLPLLRPDRWALVVGAEVCLDDARVVGDVGRVPLGDLATVVKDDDAVGHAHHRLHDMFDHDYRDVTTADLTDQLDETGTFHRVETGHDLVEQQHPRSGGQRPGDLEQLAAGQSELARQPVGTFGQPDEVQDLHRDDSRVAASHVRWPAVMVSHQDVLQHCQPSERPHDLVGAADAQADRPVRGLPTDLLAVEQDAPALRRGGACGHREQGALSGPVRPNETEDLTLVEVEVDVVDRLEAPEVLADRLADEDRGHVGPLLVGADPSTAADFRPPAATSARGRYPKSLRNRSNRPVSPSGSKRMIRISTVPYRPR